MTLKAQSPMRIVAWNINHRAREKAIRSGMAGAIASLDPDVIVLTEYVHGPSRDAFISQLGHHGLSHWLVSECRSHENHVLIAARTPLEPGDIIAPEIASSLPSNTLHAKLPQLGFEVLGLRVPDYSKDSRTKRACWDWVIEASRAMVSRPAVLIGDFNTDPGYSKDRCGHYIGILTGGGWHHGSPDHGASYWSPGGSAVRIDHAFVSGHFVVESAAYVTEANGYAFAGKGPVAFSDHAALKIDIRRIELSAVGKEDITKSKR